MQSFRNRQAHSCLRPDKNVARDREQAWPREQEGCHQRNGGSQTLGSAFSDPGARYHVSGPKAKPSALSVPLTFPSPLLSRCTADTGHLPPACRVLGSAGNPWDQGHSVCSD